MIQESEHSALSRIEDSYCVGDVIIASTAVIGNGVVLRADPGCSITIRDGVCLGAGVILHASSGSLELHQGVCVAGGTLIVGAGLIGSNACIGAGATLINPNFADGSVVSSHSLWGDESRAEEPAQCEPVIESDNASVGGNEGPTGESAPETESKEFEDPWGDSTPRQSSSPPTDDHDGSDSAERTITPPRAQISKQVIGIQQFEMMVQKMFPDRKAFQDAQSGR